MHIYMLEPANEAKSRRQLKTYVCLVIETILGSQVKGEQSGREVAILPAEVTLGARNNGQVPHTPCLALRDLWAKSGFIFWNG